MPEAQTEHKEASTGLRLCLIVSGLILTAYLVYEQRFGMGATLTEFERYGSLARSLARFEALSALLVISALVDIGAGILVASVICLSPRRREAVGVFGLVASICLAVALGEFLRTWMPWFAPLGAYALCGALISILVAPLFRERGVLHMAGIAFLVGSVIATDRQTNQIKVISGRVLGMYRQREFESLAPIRFLSVSEDMALSRRAALANSLWSERSSEQIPLVLTEWESDNVRELQIGGVPGYQVELPPDTLWSLIRTTVQKAERLLSGEADAGEGLSSDQFFSLAALILGGANISPCVKPAEKQQEIALPFELRTSLTDGGPVFHCNALPGSYEIIVATPTGSLSAKLDIAGSPGRIQLPDEDAAQYRTYVAQAQSGMPVLVRLRLGIHASAWIQLTLP